MKTTVEIRVVVNHETDEEYNNIMNTIESAIKISSCEIESVDVGIGHDYE